jgi:hypothetical protein
MWVHSDENVTQDLAGRLQMVDGQGGLGMTIRIAVRFYSGDRQRHFYRIDQLDNPAQERVAPVCRDFPYPRRHPRDMVSEGDRPELGDSLESCRGCAVWARKNPYALIVRGLVIV